MSFGGRGGAPGGGYDDMAQMASMHMMMGIMKSCFADCISNFSSSDLSQSEDLHLELLQTYGWLLRGCRSGSAVDECKIRRYGRFLRAYQSTELI